MLCQGPCQAKLLGDNREGTTRIPARTAINSNNLALPLSTPPNTHESRVDLPKTMTSPGPTLSLQQRKIMSKWVAISRDSIKPQGALLVDDPCREEAFAEEFHSP